MKDLIVMTVLLSCSNAIQAQVTDTLGWSNFILGTDTLYESPNGGYAFGNNGYNDIVKAQTFSDSVSFVLKEAWLSFGAIESSSQDATSSIMVNVYLNSGLGITLFSDSDTVAPNQIISSREVLVGDLVKGGLTKVDFSSETIVIGAGQLFSIGVSFESLAAGDTVGLVSTTDGDADGTQRAWELTEENNWIVVSQPAYSWNLDVDLGIFAVTDRNDPAGVHDFPSIEKLAVYPNPTTDVLYLILSSFSDSESLDVVIANQLGQVVSHDYLNKQSGSSLDLNGLETGVYTIRVSSESRTSLAKFVKQ